MTDSESSSPSISPDSASETPRWKQRQVDLATWDQDDAPRPHERTSDARAKFMFQVAVASLFIIALLTDHHVFPETVGNPLAGWWLWGPLLVLWVIIILEGLLGMACTHCHPLETLKRFLVVIACPPFRAAFASAYPNRFVWLPYHGWIRVNRLNFERVELRLALPMLAVTLLVLPLLGIELFLSEWLSNHLWAAVVVHCLTAFLWFAFALELVVMLAMAEKKLAYCKAHWINIAIIILPLIAFLRFLRIARLAKILRAYRMRGLVARTMRLALVFNLIERVLERNPEKYLAALQEKVDEKYAEIDALEEKMDELRQRIAYEKAAALEEASLEGRSQISS